MIDDEEERLKGKDLVERATNRLFYIELFWMDILSYCNQAGQ